MGERVGRKREGEREREKGGENKALEKEKKETKGDKIHEQKKNSNVGIPSSVRTAVWDRLLKGKLPGWCREREEGEGRGKRETETEREVNEKVGFLLDTHT